MNIGPGFRIAVGCLLVVILLAPVVHADMIVPRLTYVFFDMAGHPYDGPVNYTVTCYGYGMNPYKPLTQAPGSYQPQPVYRYTENYTGYGSPGYQQIYPQFVHFDWCDLEGVTDTRNFTIRNLSPAMIHDCDQVAERISRNFGGIKKYYYTTPEYISCRNFEKTTAGQWDIEILNFSKTNTMPRYNTVLQLPGRNLLYGIGPHRYVPVNRSDIDMNLEHYVAYLETCKANTDPACPGGIADGTPLKSFPEYRTLKKNATHLKESPCDTFLLEQDPSLILPFIADFRLLDHPCIDEAANFIPCNLTGEICESRFTIPSDIDLGNTSSGTNILLPTPIGSANVHHSPVESLFCSILSRFNMSCEET